MYAKWVNTHVPALDRPIGYDLMIGDWVAPFGKGASEDILFTGHFNKKAGGESDFTSTVSFSNKGDGIQPFIATEADKASSKAGGLLSSQEAPADGYQSHWIQTDSRKPSQPVETNRDENRNYFFRIRTVLDENGNVKSAFYGKIYGDFMHFRYYLNPTPNDQNIEFDPSKICSVACNPSSESARLDSEKPLAFFGLSAKIAESKRRTKNNESSSRPNSPAKSKPR